MNLYLARHAEAGNANSDSKRELTEFGKTTLINSIKIWKQFIDEIEYIITSPYLRAKQTAELIKSEFAGSTLFEDRKLTPGSNSEDLLEILKVLESQNILIVGHMPDLSYHVSFLVSYSGTRCVFEPAALACISFNGNIIKGGGVLKFLLPPVK